MTFPTVALTEIARPVLRPVLVTPGTSYRTIGVKWWGEGAYERETIDGLQTAARTLSIVQEDDLIINKIWVRHGSTAIASKSVEGCAASGEFPTFELDNSQILPRWMHWLTKSQDFWQKCDSLSRGTSGKNRIKPELFLTIQIPLPSLKVQKRIIEKIETITSKIEEACRRSEATKLDVHRILLGQYTILTKYADHLPMKEVAPLKRRPIQIEPEMDYYELGIRSFGKGTFHKVAVSGASLGTKNIFKIEQNDLLFNIVFAWEGAVAIAKPEDDGRVGSHRFLTCIPKKGLTTSSFLYFHFLTERGLQQLLDASPGSAGRNRTLGIKALEEIRVPVPPFEKQLWFDSLQAKLYLANQEQEKTSKELDAMLPSILDKAFKGEL